MSATRSVPRTPTDGEVRLITKIARRYHERGVRQVEIAATLHLSQTRVSRLLRRATELGIVRTVVAVSQGVHPDLEEALERRYHLAEALVVDVQGTDHDIAAALGSAGASYLETTLTGGERIGISSWSQTLLAAVDRMQPLRLSGADSVVQLVGGFGAASAQAEGNRLLSELARLIGARPIFVPAPGLVRTRAVRDSLLGDPAVRAVVEEWERLTTVLVGIGSLPPSPLLRASGNAVDPAEQDKLLAAGAVGDVCQRYFDANGVLVAGDLDNRVVGISPDRLRQVRRRVGIAGGPGKQAAIRAALRGGWVNVLLTDTGTAEFLLRNDATARPSPGQTAVAPPSTMNSAPVA